MARAISIRPMCRITSTTQLRQRMVTGPNGPGPPGSDGPLDSEWAGSGEPANPVGMISGAGESHHTGAAMPGCTAQPLGRAEEQQFGGPAAGLERLATSIVILARRA